MSNHDVKRWTSQSDFWQIIIFQVEHGDLERTAAAPPSASSPASPQPKSQLLLLQALERFYPKRYKHNCGAEQLRSVFHFLCLRLTGHFIRYNIQNIWLVWMRQNIRNRSQYDA